MLSKFSIYSLLVLSLVICIVLGCGDDNEVNSTDEIFTKNQFPIAVGSQWEYVVNDPRLECVNCGDTIVVSIIDSTTTTSDNINEIWHIIKNDTNITWNQNIHNDSINLKWDNFLAFKIKLPFKVGDIWKDLPNVTLYTDSTRVTGYGSITTPAGTFDNAFIIEGVKQAFEGYQSFKAWVVPNVGIVRLDYTVSEPMLNIDVVSQWELISYSQTGDFNHFTVEQFPNLDGSNWNYDFKNFNYNNGMITDSTIEDVYVHLAESSTVATWSYQFTDSTVIEYVEMHFDTVSVYSDHMLTQKIKHFPFPFSIDQSWVVADRTSEITNIINFSYDGYLYFPTYLISTEIDCGADCTIKEITYYTPFLGMVYKSSSKFNSDLEFTISTLTNLEVWEVTNINIPLTTH